MMENQAVTDWLLEEENPSVRYRTLTELLDASPSDPAVTQTRQRIAESAAVRRIFSFMQPDGYWLWHGKGENVEYSCSSSTHFVLSFLGELGLDRSDARVALAVERYLSLKPPDLPSLKVWQIPPDYRNHQSCLYAFNLRTFIMLGYRGDPRVQERVDVLLSDSRSDGGYLCDRPSFKAKTRSCIRGSQKALMAFAALPDLWGTPRCRQLVDYFLRRRLLFRMDRPEALVREELTRTRFPFLYHGSLLESLYALSKMGYGWRPELAEAWDLLRRKRQDDGRFLLEDTAKTYFDAGTRGQPNRWVTLYALLAEKYLKTDRVSNFL